MPPPKKQPPAAPSGLTAIALSPSEIHLSWQDKSNNESKFYIDQAIGEGNFQALAVLDANLHEFDARQLQPNTRYRFRVKASNKWGSSPFSNVSEAITPAVEPDPPPAPTTDVIFKAGILRARAKAAANHPDWLALKAQADTYLTYAVPPYHRDQAPPNSINYLWQGSGWYDAVLPLALAYQVTGNVAYATKVQQVVDVIIAAGLPPIQVDQGYPTRSAGFALTIAYNWTGETWTDAQRLAARSLMQTWHDWVSVSAFAADGADPSSNYFGGHLLGIGLGGVAMGLPTVAAHWREKFTGIETAFTSGVLQSGYPAESFNYGPAHFQRLLWYMQGYKDLIGEDLVADKPAKILQSLVDHRKPNRWQFSDEGSFSGATTGIITHDLPTILVAISTAPVNGYAAYFHQTMAPSGVPFYNHDAVLIVRVLFEDTTIAPLDYRSVFPKARRSVGDEHLIWRSSWDDDATWITFAGNAKHLAGHAGRCAGHLAVQIGNDYLLINSGQWKGTTGVSGNPQAFADQNDRYNTLIYPHLWNAQYNGGQGYWGQPTILDSTVTPDYAYMVSDLTTAYHHVGGVGLTTLTRWLRTVVILQDNSIVVRDDVRGPDAKVIPWHAPLNAWTLTPTGAVAAVGTSKLSLTTDRPLNIETDPVSGSNPTPITSRLEIRTSETDVIVLTVLQPHKATNTPSDVGPFENGRITVGGQTVTFMDDAVTVTPAGDSGTAITLTADVTLAGSDVLSWVGTPTVPLTVNGNGHRIIIGANWTGAIVIDHAIVSDLGTAALYSIGNAAGTDYGYLDGASITIQHTEFHRCRGVNVYSVNNASLLVEDCTIHPNQLSTAGATALMSDVWFTENGTSTAAKLFRRNRLHQGAVVCGSPNWTIGGSSADANLFIGRRVGLSAPSTISGRVSHNYIHGTLDVTPEQSYWSQLSLLTNIGSGVTVEKNIALGAHWIVQVCNGRLLDNVLAHASGHPFINIGTGLIGARNILLDPYPAAATYPNGMAGMSEAVALPQSTNAMTLADTVIDARSSNAPGKNFYVEPGARLTESGTKRLTSSGTVQGPLPTGFPFNDADLLSGTYTVQDLLDYFAWVYGPPTGNAPPTIVTTNKRPAVYAGPSFAITAGQVAQLWGYGADDGLPSNVLTFEWAKVSGPGAVSFKSLTDPHTESTFTLSGTYGLRLTATDGVLSSTSDCTITVNA